MKKITFDEMIEKSDPRYGVPLANIDDIKNIQVPTKSEPKIIVASDPMVSKHLMDISNKLDKPSSQVVFPTSMRISNPSSFSKDASRIIEAINNKELKVVIPKAKKEKKEKEELKKDMLCYKISDSKEPVTGYQYFGFINPEGGWYIIYNDAIENQVRYKFGKDDYAKAWENYANLDYKIYNEAIDEIKD